MKIGLLAGTFDPVHVGHIKFARIATEIFSLAKIVFLPEREPRGKKNVTKFDDRIKMLQLAVEGYEGFEVFDSGEGRLTLKDTLPKLKKNYPNSEFLIMLGSDAARRLPAWEGIEDLIPDVLFLVAIRGINEDEINVFSNFALAEKMNFIHSPDEQASSSLIRLGKVKAGIPAVDEYIKSHKLYV